MSARDEVERLLVSENFIAGVPSYKQYEFAEKRNDYCACVFVINEGEKLIKQLDKMKTLAGIVDIVVADGGSADGSTKADVLMSRAVNTLLVKTGVGKLGAQMRMAFYWALRRGYKGVVVVDGNGKDSVEDIPSFVGLLEDGFDHVQGSRFISGGHHENTPWSRLVGVRLVHAPLIRLASGFPYTDTTNGFRAYSARFLLDPSVGVFRNIFGGYELHYYMAIEAARRGFRCTETPVSRRYPSSGPVPTKISPLKGNLLVLYRLISVVLGRYRVR